MKSEAQIDKMAYLIDLAKTLSAAGQAINDESDDRVGELITELMERLGNRVAEYLGDTVPYPGK
jgi:ribosome assembly protein YihI (activator of Der GTPase)